MVILAVPLGAADCGRADAAEQTGFIRNKMQFAVLTEFYQMISPPISFQG